MNDTISLLSGVPAAAKDVAKTKASSIANNVMTTSSGVSLDEHNQNTPKRI